MRPRLPRLVVLVIGLQCILVVVFTCIKRFPLVIRLPKMHFKPKCKPGLNSFSTQLKVVSK